MLRWLKINRYRNVVPGTELTFSEGHHVLLGPNGGGKTTLLELIAAVLRGDFASLNEQEYSISYCLTKGDSEIEATVSHYRLPTKDATLDTEWKDDITATLRHAKDPTRQITIDDEEMQVTTVAPVGSAGHEPIAKSRNFALPAMRLHRVLWRSVWSGDHFEDASSHDPTWDGAFRFDEALQFFDFLLGRGELAGRSLTISLTVDYQTKTIKSATHHYLLSPIVTVLLADMFAPRSVEPISLPLASLGSMDNAIKLLGLGSGSFRIELSRNERTDDQERLTYERFQFRFLRRDGTMVLGEHLSFGQKRLLAFLFYAWANDGPIVADELVDGMHYRWIEHCLKTIRGRQAFLSSQNPLLMDFIPLDSAERVQQTFVICDVEERDGRERMRWRNLTPDEAGDFFNAYEVGIQHVSEILRDKGLW